MSGHSKWSKIKHQKESTDAVKGKIFTKLASAIIIAVRDGGGITNPSDNFHLRLAVEKAREANVPKENIERAIEKGAGGGDGAHLERVVYEAFGPGKAGLIIEAATDNHQRTTAEVKNILDKGGGVLTAQGAVSYLFTYVGLVETEKKIRFDQMMSIVIDAGGQDFIEEGEKYKIYTDFAKLHEVKVNLENKGIVVTHAELIYRPKIIMSLTEEDKNRVFHLIGSLEEASDVHNVYSNIEE